MNSGNHECQAYEEETNGHKTVNENVQVNIVHVVHVYKNYTLCCASSEVAKQFRHFLRANPIPTLNPPS